MSEVMSEPIYIPVTLGQVKKIKDIKIPLRSEEYYYIYEVLEYKDIKKFEKKLIALPSTLELTDKVKEQYNLFI